MKKDEYKMARASEHKIWELQINEEFELCHVTREDEENYYGMFLEGIGAFNVRFPKKYTRDLTESEAKKYSSGGFVLSGIKHTYTKDELLNKPLDTP